MKLQKFLREKLKIGDQTLTKDELVSYLGADRMELTEQQLTDVRNDDGAIFCIIGNCYCIRNDYSKAYSWFKLAVTQNYSEGRYQIGRLYLNGRGKAVNLHKATKWFLKAANVDNHKYARDFVRQIYGEGLIAPKDVPSVVEYFTRFATDNQGASDIQLLLCKIYEGDKKLGDLQKARYWYKQAERNGESAATFYLTRLNN